MGLLHKAAALVGGLAGCAGDDGPPTDLPTLEAPMTITVTSPAFADQDPIPQRFTCDGADVSPPLELTGVPPAAAELALLVEDPDAPGGRFVHRVAWGIDTGTASLAAGEPPAGAVQGCNDFRRTGCGGPWPPPGDPHAASR